MKYFFLYFLFFIPNIFFAQNAKDKEQLIQNYYESGYTNIYIQKDSAYYNFEKALGIAKEIENFDYSISILYYLIITADYHSDLLKYRNTLKDLNKVLSKQGIEDQIQDFKTWNNTYFTLLASYYFETKEYVKAKEFYLKSRNYFDDIPTEQLSINQAQNKYSIYSSLGTTYMHLENYELAELNFLKSIKLANTNAHLKENAAYYISAANQSIAQLYMRTGKYNKANILYIENLELNKINYKKNKKFKNNVIHAFQNITHNLIAQDSLKKALFYLKESKIYLLEEDPFYKDALLLYGDIYVKLNENQKALDSYNNALDLFSKFRQSKPHQDIAEVYGKMAELFLKQKKYKEGLQTVKKAFNFAGTNIQIKDFKKNPNPQKVFSKTQLLYLLDLKLQLLQGSYQETGKASYQDASLLTIHDALMTFDYLKSEFDSKLDKQFLVEKAYPIFHRLLETAYKAYERKPVKETLQLALTIAEKNKDFVLLEVLRNAHATKYGKVPSSIVEKEAQLRADISNFEKQLFDATENENGYSDVLFKKKQTYYDFLDTIKVNYPKYHQLKYSSKVIDITEVKKNLLENNTSLVSYTVAGNYMYVIVLNREKEDFIKLPYTETTRNDIKEFYHLLSSPSIKGGKNTIGDIAHSLFKQILQKPLEISNTENLTIIPDAELHYLPFDLLQENDSFLLATKSISYGNSVTSLLELNRREGAKENKMLAYAPSFLGAVTDNADRQFGKLLYNDDEVQNIEAFYNTESVFNEKATLENFITQTSKFNIFHLASHASANDTYPDYSYLAFSEIEGTKEDHVLYVKDLYDMSLNADMVTLSACQTGIGRLQKGQGMMSLSKGFYYAGAKSLVTTLWKINDKSTVKLMGFFYEGLSKGKSKKEALRDAKLTYLETTEDELLKHPYYWAAFTVSGNVSPLQSNTSSIWWWCLGGFVCIGAFLWYRKKTSI